MIQARLHERQTPLFAPRLQGSAIGPAYAFARRLHRPGGPPFRRRFKRRGATATQPRLKIPAVIVHGATLCTTGHASRRKARRTDQRAERKAVGGFSKTTRPPLVPEIPV